MSVPNKCIRITNANTEVSNRQASITSISEAGSIRGEQKGDVAFDGDVDGLLASLGIASPVMELA